jgi:FkbM family methyltransferase
MIKQLTKSTLLSLGLDVKWSRYVPFGVEWYQDIKYCQKGQSLEVIIDVGANIGQTALTAQTHFPNSFIYCFEPVPSTFHKLVTSVQRFPNIKTINQALGEEVSKAPITAIPLAQQNTLVLGVNNNFTTSTTETVVVDVNTLDNFCIQSSIKKVNLLKIDTEGYEMNVLKGAKQLLSSHSVDYILVECDFFTRSDAPHGNFFDIFNYLQQFNYNVVSFYTGGVDDCGWKWGDVLLRKSTNLPTEDSTTSPFNIKRFH